LFKFQKSKTCHILKNISPKPPADAIRYGTEAIALGILKHLKLRHGNADICTSFDIRQDVYQYLLAGKGTPSERKGWTSMEKDDFSRCNFPNGWEYVVDHLGDGKKVVFPIRMRHFLSWGPKSYVMASQTLAPAKRYHQEKLSICFATTAFAVN
jgi:hypothetical protein